MSPAPSSPDVSERQRGPVTLRRGQIQDTTTDERLLDSRGPSDWVHTDPWRVLRIQREFVEGFGALAELGPAVGVFGSARTSADSPEYALGGEARPQARRGRLRGHHRRGPRHHGGRQPGRLRGRRRLGRARHRAPLRAGPQPLRRPLDQLPLLLRAQDDVRQVRRGVRHLPRRVRDPRRALRGPDPRPDAKDHSLPDRPRGQRLLGGSVDWIRGAVLESGKVAAGGPGAISVTDEVDGRCPSSWTATMRRASPTSGPPTRLSSWPRGVRPAGRRTARERYDPGRARAIGLRLLRVLHGDRPGARRDGR